MDVYIKHLLNFEIVYTTVTPPFYLSTNEYGYGSRSFGPGKGDSILINLIY